ncbi:MAG TPA: hypothetical protein VK154_19470 [Chitinophagales bacterium]|nr:hypothetical protein [Chitinophagales bacterium]
MALFSENIVYRSPLDQETALQRLSKEIKRKRTLLEHFSEPAQYFRGIVNGNTFRLTYESGRSFGPDIEGEIEQVEDGCLATVKISFPGFRLGLIIMLVIGIIMTIILAAIGGILWFGLSVIILIFNSISYKWASSHSKALLENVFKTVGEEQ